MLSLWIFKLISAPTFGDTRLETFPFSARGQAPQNSKLAVRSLSREECYRTANFEFCGT